MTAFTLQYACQLGARALRMQTAPLRFHEHRYQKGFRDADALTAHRYFARLTTAAKILAEFAEQPEPLPA